MGRLLLGLVVLLAVAGCVDYGLAGPARAQTDQDFEAVFEVPGATQAEIFTATRIWIAENFKSAKAVLEYEDKAEGTLIGNGKIKYPCATATAWDCLAKGAWMTSFTMRVDTKDGRFKLSFMNLGVSWPSSYNSILGTLPAYDGPITAQADYEAIKASLLEYGPVLAEAIQRGGASKDW